jgi:4-amino-4-deoxy-L-arabinose transferase-like glycosyltransferase
MSQRLQHNLLLAAILLLALFLRVWGLDWGLPSATHYFSYHPDETTVLNAAMSMSLFRGQLLPHYYNYGSLQIYLILIANTLDYLFGHGVLIIHNVTTQYAPWARMYLVGRALTVAMGVGTVWAVYLLGTRLWGHRAGLLSGIVLAIMPIHAQQSHWLTVDVPATFWATLSLVWVARLATDDPKPLRAALLAGLFAGLAAATKYNLALALLPLAFATLRPFPGREGTGRLRPGLGLFCGCSAAALAFLITCPGFLLDSTKFWQDFRYEANHVQHLPGAEFAHTGSGLVFVIARNLDAGLGLPLLLLCLVSIVYAVCIALLSSH